MLKRTLVVVGLASCLAMTGTSGLAAAPQAKPALPTIVVLATGGTIAGAAATDTQAGYTSGQVGVDQLLAAVPQAKKLANMRGEQISNIGSQDMNDEVWLKLAKRVNELVAMPDVAGVVITHGTDTIEETAYFLNLVVKSKKPVVLTASMRPSTALSADGPLNFFNAVAVAANQEAAGRGVLVVINDWIHGASSLTKTSTTAVQTFMSPLRGLVGTVAYGVAEFYRGPVGKHTFESEFSLDGVTALPRVDIIMAYENMDGALIDAAVAAGAKGVVIAGVGNGNLTAPAVKALAAQSKKGVVCVRSTRVATGLVGRNVELDDDALGFVASMGLNPQKSRVLLRLALTKTKDPKEIQRYFIQYLAPAHSARHVQDRMMKERRMTTDRSTEETRAGDGSRVARGASGGRGPPHVHDAVRRARRGRGDHGLFAGGEEGGGSGAGAPSRRSRPARCRPISTSSRSRRAR